jgi:Ca2+-binding EF-hand superfamily protein
MAANQASKRHDRLRIVTHNKSLKENAMKIKPLFLSVGMIAVAMFLVQTVHADPPGKDRQNGANRAQRGDRANGERNMNRDGQQQGRKRGGRRGMPNPEMLIQRFDQDGDGQLATSELPEKMQGRIGKVDADQDGFITAAELTTAFENRGGQRGGQRGEGEQGRRRMDPARMIEKMDKDGDGKISLTEAPERMQTNFANVDTNGDGFVESSELQVAMENMRQRGGNREGKGKGKTGRKGKRGQGGDGGLNPVEPKRPPADFPL